MLFASHFGILTRPLQSDLCLKAKHWGSSSLQTFTHSTVRAFKVSSFSLHTVQHEMFFIFNSTHKQLAVILPLTKTHWECSTWGESELKVVVFWPHEPLGFSVCSMFSAWMLHNNRNNHKGLRPTPFIFFFFLLPFSHCSTVSKPIFFFFTNDFYIEGDLNVAFIFDYAAVILELQ